MASYKINKENKTKFLHWLVDNNLTIRKFAKKCGVSHQYLSSVLNGRANVTETVVSTFKKGGYELKGEE